MGREEEKFVGMREFSRVDAHIPFGVRVIPKEEQKNLHSKISGDAMVTEFRELPDLQDKLLSDWMKMLNTKLDAIINMLVFQREGFSSLPFNHVNISGGGLSFWTKERFTQGDVLEVKMMLPMMPPVAMYVYGEVVKIDPQGPSSMIAIKFIAMDEQLRDEIVKFVFKRQREILREKRR
ncbi:MAG TPA: PilZ domain-containing protein [Dissulfurispiraceae bacterium]